MERYYEIAGVQICVQGNSNEMPVDQRLLKYFTTENVTDPYRFRFSLVESLDGPAGLCMFQSPSSAVYFDGDAEIRYIGSVQNNLDNAYLRTSKTGKLVDVQVVRNKIVTNITSKVVLNSFAMERLALEADGVVLHASYIVVNGRAILFTAPSETGKSTQAELWERLRGAEIINGDRAIIRWMDGVTYACGLPFAGSSKFCKNVTAPLAGIVYLGQAPKTAIQRLSVGQAFCRVWEGCSVASWCSEDVEKATTIVQNIVTNVPVFYLQCTPDESAVLALEQELQKIDVGDFERGLQEDMASCVVESSVVRKEDSNG